MVEKVAILQLTQIDNKVLTIKVNGEVKGTYDGKEAIEINIEIPEAEQVEIGTLTIKQGGETKGIYDGTTKTIDLDGIAVTSVNEKTGNVILNSSDVGLDHVDNTSDEDKPISRETQAALDSKANNTDLAKVAKSGNYNDLLNTPTIPATITVDKALNVSSTNPVENAAIAQKINTISTDIDTLWDEVDTKSSVKVEDNGDGTCNIVIT